MLGEQALMVRFLWVSSLFFLAMTASLLFVAAITFFVSANRWAALTEYVSHSFGTILLVLVFSSALVGLVAVLPSEQSRK